MLAEIGMAFGISLVAMIVVGTIVKGILGFRSAVNYVAQQATLGAIAYLAFSAGFALPAVAILALFPLVVHAITQALVRYIAWKTARGGYGEEAKWAYELFKEGDREFVRAQTHLPQMDVREVVVIADDKQEFRDLMVERFEERVEENT